MNNPAASSTFNGNERKFSGAFEKYRTIATEWYNRIKVKRNEEELNIRPVPNSIRHIVSVKSSTQGLQIVADTDEIDPLLRIFLHFAGLSGSILSNPEHRRTINQFVGENRVIQSMRAIERNKKRKTKKVQAPMVSRPKVSNGVPPRPPPPPPPMQSNPTKSKPKIPPKQNKPTPGTDESLVERLQRALSMITGRNPIDLSEDTSTDDDEWSNE